MRRGRSSSASSLSSVHSTRTLSPLSLPSPNALSVLLPKSRLSHGGGNTHSQSHSQESTLISPSPPWSPAAEGPLHGLSAFDGLLFLLTTLIIFLIARWGVGCGWVLSAFLGMIVAVLVFLATRLLHAPLNHAALLASEEAVIATAGVAVRHEWHSFSTPRVALWHMHSLAVTGDAGAKAARAACGAPPLPPLILLHGHSGGAAHWEAILASCARAGVDAWAISLPGWGRSPEPPEVAAATLAMDRAQGPEERDDASVAAVATQVEGLVGWLKARGLYGKAAVAGHSYGGFLAASIAGADPNASIHVVLASPAGLHPLAPSRESIASAWLLIIAPPQRLARVGGRAAAAFTSATIRNLFPQENTTYPTYYAQLAWAAGRGGGAGGGADFVRALLPYDIKAGKGWWAAPALPALLATGLNVGGPAISLLWGSRDTVNEPAVGALLHRIKSGVDLYWIAGALHNSAHSHPRPFSDALLHTLAARAAERRGREGGAAAASAAAALPPPPPPPPLGILSQQQRAPGRGEGGIEKDRALAVALARAAATGRAESALAAADEGEEGGCMTARFCLQTDLNTAKFSPPTTTTKATTLSRADSAHSGAHACAHAHALEHIHAPLLHHHDGGGGDSPSVPRCSDCAMPILGHGAVWVCTCGNWSHATDIYSSQRGDKAWSDYCAFLDEATGMAGAGAGAGAGTTSCSRQGGGFCAQTSRAVVLRPGRRVTPATLLPILPPTATGATTANPAKRGHIWIVR